MIVMVVVIDLNCAVILILVGVLIIMVAINAQSDERQVRRRTADLPFLSISMCSR